MRTVEMKTAELIGPALDWAVAKAGAVTVEENGLWFDEDHQTFVGGPVFAIPYRPSTIWAQGGPLIDKYRPDIQTSYDGNIVVLLNNDMKNPDPLIEGRGETYLVALCRAIIAAKLGDTVSVPAELAPRGPK